MGKSYKGMLNTKTFEIAGLNIHCCSEIFVFQNMGQTQKSEHHIINIILPKRMCRMAI